MRLKFFAILKTAIALLYPYLVYQGMQAGVVWFAPSIIAGFFLYQAYQTTEIQAKITKASMATALLIGVVFLPNLTAKILPVAIQLLLMYFFGKTLFPTHAPPLIERFARLEFPDIPAEIAVYTRLLTQIWTAFFAFNALTCTVLAVFAPLSWWAMYTGVGIFVLTAALMMAEYIYRRFLFPELEIADFKSSVKNMAINCKSIWQNVQAG